MKFLIPTMFSIVSLALGVEYVLAVRRLNSKMDKIILETGILQNRNKISNGAQPKKIEEANNQLSFF